MAYIVSSSRALLFKSHHRGIETDISKKVYDWIAIFELHHRGIETSQGAGGRFRGWLFKSHHRGLETRILAAQHRL